jgi:hypothetical protein
VEQVRVYHLTLSTRGYSLGENAWSFEVHFTTALSGGIHNVREKLRALAFPYFQRLVLERYGQHIPLDRIRGEFEREEQALGPSADITVEPLEISYRGKMHHATSLPTQRLPSDIVAYDPEYEPAEFEIDEDDDEEEDDEDDFEDDEPDELDEEYDEGDEYDDE